MKIGCSIDIINSNAIVLFPPGGSTPYLLDGSFAGTFTRASSAWNPDTGAVALTDVGRYVAGKSGSGLLIEEASTNIILQSNQFDTTWAQSGTPSPVKNQTDPYGNVNTAWTLTDNSASSELLYQVITLTAANHTFSVLVNTWIFSLV